MEISISGKGLLCLMEKRLPGQLLRVMRLTAILLTIFCLHVSARSYEQTVSFKGKDVTLEYVFSSIERQTGLSFFFNYNALKDTKLVTMDVRDMPLETFLSRLLKNEGLDYYKQGKTVFVVKATSATPSIGALDSALFTDQVLNIKGKVINQVGEPLASATISIKNGRRSTLTNAKGEFELKGIVSGVILEVSYLGYQKREIAVQDGGDIMVQLRLADNRLDEAQVIAYGQTTQRLSVSDVTTVKAEDIERQPVQNSLLAVEGRVPGLFITQSTGLPGAGVIAQIQGQNSIQNGNDPFYVIDGVPYTSQLLPSIAGVLLGQSAVNNGQSGGNPLSYLDPLSIESISVLKGADATAIYGSRAANGAILITTKKGKAGESKVNVSVQDGWGEVTRRLHLLNTPQFLEMRHEALRNDNISKPSATDYDINGLWDTTRYTDWQKVLIGQAAEYANASANVSGGTVNSQYFIGGTFNRQTIVFPGTFSDMKGSAHFNLNTVSTNQKFRLSLTGNYQVDDNRLPNTDLTTLAMELAPDAPKIYNSDGSLNWAPTSAGVSSWNNPLASLNNHYKNETKNLISNAVLVYHIIPGLDFNANLGYTDLTTNELITVPLTSTKPENRPLTLRGAVYGNNNINSWVVEPQLDYKHIFGANEFEVLVGTTIQQMNIAGSQLSGSGYNSDLVLGDIRSASTVTVLSTIDAVYKYNALFGRVNYNWSEKYLLNLTARRDGSSRFGSENEFHNFGAVGAGWVFSKEDFFSGISSVLNYGKLRASYGTTGNDQIGDYQYLSLYSPTSVGNPYQGTSGLLPSGLSNPYLQWEETKKLEVGVDMNFLKGRISLSATYFRNRSSNQLLGYSLPIVTGFTYINKNFPAVVENTGWELVLNTENIRSRNFVWHSGFNLTIPGNKLVSFPNIASSSYSYLVVGRPITIQRAYHFLGVDPASGVYKFASKTDPFNPVYPDDQTAIINTAPKYYGGFENDFSYKGFQLDVLLQFVNQLGPNYIFGDVPGFRKLNQPDYVLARWQKPGDITNIQKFNSNSDLSLNYVNATESDAYWSSASYIRLKNLSLSWQIPGAWIKKTHFQKSQIFIQGQNLLTITGYKGLDPENKTVYSLPPLRILSVGIQAAF